MPEGGRVWSRASSALAVALVVGLLYALVCWWNGAALSGESVQVRALQLTAFSSRGDAFAATGGGAPGLHIVSAAVDLRPRERLVYRVQVARPASAPSTLRVDLYGPGYDDPAQESVHRLGAQSYPLVLRGSIGTGGSPPPNAEFRIFYEGPDRLVLRDVRIVRVLSWRIWLEHILAACALLTAVFAIGISLERWLCRPAPRPATTAWMLTAAYGVGALLRFAVSLLLPYWSGDEYAYKGIAAGLWEGGVKALSPERLAHAVDLPNMLYPLLIAPAIGLGDEFYVGIRLINAAVVSLVVFPTYAVARRLAGARIALVVAICALVLPSANISAFAVTEVLYYPVALTALWLTLRAVDAPTQVTPQIAVGVAVAIALNVRLTALALIPAYLLALIVVQAREGRFRELATRPVWLAGLAAAYVVNAALRHTLTAAADLGVYESQPGGWLGGAVNAMIADFPGTLALLGGHAALLVVPYALGVAALVSKFAGSRGAEAAVGQRDAMVVLITFLCAFALAIAFTLSVSTRDLGGLGRWHSRYYFAYLPLLMAAGAAMVQQRPRSRSGVFAGSATLAMIVIPGIAFVTSSSGFESAWFGSTVDSMEAQWMKEWGTYGCLLVFGLWTVASAFAYRNRSPGLLLAATLVWLALANASTWRTLRNGPGADDTHCGTAVSGWLRANPGRVAAVASTREDLVDVVFWLPDLPERALTVPKGTVLRRDSVPNVDYVAVEGDVDVDAGEPVLAVGQCRVFRAN